MKLEEKLQMIQQNLAEMESVLVGFSGGVDSSLLLKIAYDVLGERAVGATAISASLAQAEREDIEHILGEIGAPHRWVQSYELENERYLENPPNRCFFCKQDVFLVLEKVAQEEGLRFILDGTNADDAGDHRPGRQAAREHGVRSPFLEVGLTKDEIRQVAYSMGLSNWDKPSAACLSSRVPYGTRISVPLLSQVEQAEACLRRMGIRQARVRHHEQVARIEVEPEDFSRILEQRESLLKDFRSLGYTYVTLDLAGFRTGSLNESLTQHQRAH